MGPGIGSHLRGLAIDQQVEHVRLDGTVDDGDPLLVLDHVEHADFERRGLGDDGVARLEIDLQAILFGERLEPRGQGVEIVALTGEMDAAAEADPVDALEERAELLLEPVQQRREGRKGIVLAIAVDHEAGDAIHRLLDAREVPFAEAAIGAGRVGEVEMGMADAGIDAEADGQVSGLGAEAVELAEELKMILSAWPMTSSISPSDQATE